jgi:YidC/Oxa1 family membrane protein insertase
MDKRTLIFIISVTATLGLVNWYFESQSIESKKEWIAQKKEQDVKKGKALQEEINANTAQLKDLPIVSLTQQDNTALGKGLQFEDYLFTLLPKDLETVYLDGASYAKIPELDTQFGVFAKQGAKPLNAPHSPLFGTYQIQIVTLMPEPKVTPGKIVDGKLILIENQARMLLGEEPLTLPDGFALQRSGSTWQPIAFFSSTTQTLTYFTQISNFPTTATEHAATLQERVEKYFVLQNETMQLVFSNIGGALAEINLPFASKDHPSSVVKEISFDRTLVQDSPKNSRFPLRPYATSANQSKLLEGTLGGYYPLLRRDLILGQGEKSISILPKFYAFNLVSEYPELAELVYSVQKFTDTSITFAATQPHRKITKTFTLDPKAPYIIHLTIEIEGDAKGIWLTTGIPEVEWISNGPAPALKYRQTRGQKSEVNVVDLPKDAWINTSLSPDWICNSNGFLGMILDPLTTIDPGFRAQFVPGTQVPSRLILIDAAHHLFPAENLPGYMMMLPLNGQGGKMEFRLFTGPFATNVLQLVDQTFEDPSTGYTPDYISSQSFHGYFAFISAPFSKLLFFLMNLFHKLTHSWGISIILLTVALRIMLYPLNAWSAKSSAKMQQIAPEVQRLQEKYKKDPKKAQLEVMNLYREKGVNPISGCFPILIQMPFLIGMFDLLKSTFELRGASFIPGWIDDLAQPDILFSWGVPIPFFGTSFHLLPILLGGVMFLQQKLMSPLPQDPNQMSEQQRQQ